MSNKIGFLLFYDQRELYNYIVYVMSISTAVRVR